MSAEQDAEAWRALGGRLRGVREYLGLSQQLVASQTGIPRSAVSDIERGVRKVDSLELKKLSKIYRYPTAYFLGEPDEEPGTVSALGRAVTDLTDEDRREVLRFAEYLRYSAQSRRQGKSDE